MQKLKLTNFKAHKYLEISLDNKNFLLYGDNGAGKSSIYEALKLVFYKDRLEVTIKKQSTAENELEKIKEFYREFDNKTLPIEDFEIEINDTSYSEFTSIDYKNYMLNLEDISFDKTLKLNELLEKVFFNLPDNMNLLCTQIQKKANKFLRKCLENVFIIIDTELSHLILPKNIQ